ncbi:hypothetical protein L6452_36582 [Arctium lappa]|uniref:Uncharacterized protein n=1 Tax=Arctium lappa TaxID=4217 RepID=A0ACB8YAV1_ARCLA|nr:hypothetical protein L6452_36582 [Arctium lappa]
MWNVNVNLLLSKWIWELEKVFYGKIVAYDNAMNPEAKPDELQNAIWKIVFSDDGSPTYDAIALPAVLTSFHPKTVSLVYSYAFDSQKLTLC